jgi:hypothetical protein
MAAACIANWLDGSWQLRRDTHRRPYEFSLNLSNFLTRGKAGAREHYGVCSDAAALQKIATEARTKSARAHCGSDEYAWVPSNEEPACKLHLLARARFCPSFPRLARIVFVGDSVLQQTYYALVLSLGGRFTIPTARGFVKHATLSCPGGHATFTFFRDDTLGPGGIKGKARAVPYATWLAAAANATVAVLSTGHHYDATDGRPFVPAPTGSPYIFTELQATLANLREARMNAGRSARSIVLVSPSSPVPNCASYHSPISNAEAMAAEHRAEHAGLRFHAQWRKWREYPRMMAWLARDAGITWLDLTTLSATRPDLHVSHFVTVYHRGKQVIPPDRRDCVHYCLPGVPDTFARVLFNAMLLKSAK